MKRSTWTVCVAICILISACGGGGGNGGGDGGGDDSANISGFNARVAAENAVGAVGLLDALAFLNEDLLRDIAEAGPAPRRGPMGRLLGRLPRTAALLPGEDTLPCDLSGSFQVTVDDVSPLDRLSSGDSATITFEECTFADGGGAAEINGQILFQVTSSGEDDDFPNPPFQLALAFTFRDLSATDGTETVTVNGGFATEVSTPDGTAFQTTVEGSSIQLEAQEGQEAFMAEISDFLVESTRDEATGDYTIDVRQGTVSSSDLDGFITIETPALRLAGTGDNNPDEGELLVTGAEGSSLTVVVLDDEDVRIDVDEDGDGTVDEQIPSTWDELDF